MAVRELLYTISPSADSTLALEISKTGLMRRKKHLLFFETFRGTLCYRADQPECSKASLVIDANSAVCRDKWLSPKKQEAVTHYAKRDVLVTDGHAEILFRSTRISPKPLRGFVVEGELIICGISRLVKVNVVLNEKKNDALQIDGDATICLSDFDIKPPSSLLGLAGTQNEGLVRILLWANPKPALLPPGGIEV